MAPGTVTDAGKWELALVTDNLPALVSYVGADGCYRFVNRAYELFFGHQRDEIRGRHLRDVLGSDTWDVIQPYVERVLAGERVDYEARLPYKGAGLHDVLATYVPHVLDDGTVEGFFVLVNDVTERKRLENELHTAEHKLARVLETVEESYYSLDTDYRITYFNAEAERYFGMKRSEVMGRHVLDVFPVAAGTVFEQSYRVAMEEHRAVVFETHSVVFRERIVEVRMHPTDDGIAVFFRDVSESHRAIDLLRQNEERLRLAMKAGSSGAWWLYEDGTVEWSRELHDLFEVDASTELSVDLWKSRVHPDDVEAALAAAMDALSGRHAYEAEFRIILPDGRMRWIASMASPLPVDGRWALIGLDQDITARKEAEENVRRSEHRYRTLVATTTAVIWRTDPAGAFVEPQERWEAYTGQGWPDQAGFGWLRMIHPEDRAAIERIWKEAVSSGSNYESEGRLWHAQSETYRAFICRGVPLLRDDGSIDEWMGMIHDVDETRHAAETMRVLAAADYALAGSLEMTTTLHNVCSVVVDSFADWCLLVMLDGPLPRVVAGMHRDPRLTEVIQSTFIGIELKADRSPDIFETLRSGKPCLRARVFPSDLPRPDDPWLDLLHDLGVESLIFAPLPGRGTTAGVLVCVSSLPERRFGDRDLRIAVNLARRAAMAIENARLYAASQSATRAKDEFLAVVSHELRTPMTSILGWTGLLRLGTPDPETVAMAIDAISDAAKAQAALVDDLLEVSRALAGKLRLDMQITTVVDAVQRAVETVSTAAAAKGVLIETSTSGPMTFVNGDPARLQQVFWNLLTNAVKFTPPGGHVSVRIDHPPGLVRVRVRDTGCGIAKDFIPLVFDRFSQEQETASRSHTGLGLGLSIAHSLVQMHGGTIEAFSDGPGTGATFTVSIPALARNDG